MPLQDEAGSGRPTGSSLLQVSVVLVALVALAVWGYLLSGFGNRSVPYGIVPYWVHVLAGAVVLLLPPLLPFLRGADGRAPRQAPRRLQAILLVGFWLVFALAVVIRSMEKDRQISLLEESRRTEMTTILSNLREKLSRADGTSIPLDDEERDVFLARLIRSYRDGLYERRRTNRPTYWPGDDDATWYAEYLKDLRQLEEQRRKNHPRDRPRDPGSRTASLDFSWHVCGGHAGWRAWAGRCGSSTRGRSTT